MARLSLISPHLRYTAVARGASLPVAYGTVVTSLPCSLMSVVFLVASKRSLTNAENAAVERRGDEPPERDSVGILGLYGADRVGVLNVDAVRAKGEVLHPPPAGVVRCDGDGAVEQLVERQLRLLALTDQGRRLGQHGETRATCRPKLPSTLLRSAMGGQPGFLKAQSLIRGGVPDLPQQDRLRDGVGRLRW